MYPSRLSLFLLQSTCKVQYILPPVVYTVFSTSVLCRCSASMELNKTERNDYSKMKKTAMLSTLFYVCTRHIHICTRISHMRDHTHDVQYAIRRENLSQKHFDEMQLQKVYIHTSHPRILLLQSLYLCPRRVCQLYLSPNVSLLLFALWQLGNETFRFRSLFFLQKRYEIPVEEKVTTSRLIVESNCDAYRLLLARNKRRNDHVSAT